VDDLIEVEECRSGCVLAGGYRVNVDVGDEGLIFAGDLDRAHGGKKKLR